MRTPTSKRVRSSGLFGAALEDYLWRGQQKQRGRAGVVGRGRRHMRRSNLRYAIRPEGWRDWLAGQISRRLARRKSKPIPVSIRPGVPRVDRSLRDPAQRRAILESAREMLPRHQFRKVYAAWL